MYKCDTAGNVLSQIRISQGDVVQIIPKAVKPDHEALAFDDDFIYAIGSGSTSMRCRIAVINRATDALEKQFDATNLYKALQDASGIESDQLNIEGAIKGTDGWFLFQRGNGSAGANGIFAVDNIFDDSPKITYKAVALDFEKGLSIGFTDAILDGDHIYFLAAAEDTASTYLDGEVLGSWIGVMDARSLKVLDHQLISRTQKFEGIAICKKEAMKISFLVCEDNDSEALSSDVWALNYYY